MVRFGMSGCGSFIENAVLPMMAKTGNSRAVAAFDPDQKNLHRVCRKFGIKQVCTTFEELLRVKEVDAVYIASPNYLHKDQTILAAKAKKHVFCQKPMALNAAEAEKMLNACRNNQVKLGIGFCYRFGGAQQSAKKLLKEGVIGKISYVYLSWNLAGYNPKTVGWRCAPKLSGGGPLMDLAPHLIDLCSFFLDDRVESVMAYVHPPKTDKKVEIDTLSIMQFVRGVRASMDTSFVRGNAHNYTIVGTEGEIHAVATMPWLTRGKKPGELFYTKKGYGSKIEVNFSAREHIRQEMFLYCQAIEKNIDVPVPGEAGFRAQAVIDAIYESGRTGRRCLVSY